MRCMERAERDLRHPGHGPMQLRGQPISGREPADLQSSPLVEPSVIARRPPWHGPRALWVGATVIMLAIPGAAVADDWSDAAAAYERQEYATALRLWRPLAEQGNADAQFDLGGMYETGQGVP